MKKINKTKYNRRVWLNSIESSMTGSMVLCDVTFYVDGEDDVYQFIEISDCHHKVRLHADKSDSNPTKSFMNKLKTMRDELDLFINHLSNSESTI